MYRRPTADRQITPQTSPPKRNADGSGTRVTEIESNANSLPTALMSITMRRSRVEPVLGIDTVKSAEDIWPQISWP